MTRAPDTLLDVSRTISRLGAGGDSGVDRVERAYIRHLAESDGKVLFLTRVMGGVALLDRAGMAQILNLADDPAQLETPDILGHLSRRQSPERRRADTAARRCAIAWVLRPKMTDLLRGALAPGFRYLNVGHTHLQAARIAAIRAAGAGQIAVLIHDVIPLDFPEFSRPAAPTRFAELLRGAAEAADLLIYNSQDTARRAAHWLNRWDLAPPSVTALLGVDPPDRSPSTTPSAQASFVMLGTIEPRKNHLLPLSIWRQLNAELPADQIPHLHIIGRRGWENENILAILKRAPFMGKNVFEHGYLSDAQVADRMRQAHALLFPSFAEGFGYPLAEALQLGLPTICADLPVFREIAPQGPTYLDPLDGPGWKTAILSAAKNTKERSAAHVAPLVMPDWPTHFSTVFGRLDNVGATKNENAD